jgi:hypothetical protein
LEKTLPGSRIISPHELIEPTIGCERADVAFGSIASV